MKKVRRKPTYGAAVRLARIASEVCARPYGWSFKAIAAELQISERTLARYVSALRGGLLDFRGAPMFEVVGAGPSRRICLATPAKAPEASAYQVAFLYFSLTVLKFLEGTVLKEGMEGLWERMNRGLTFAQRSRLTDLERKFYAVLYAPKDYTAFSDQLDIIVRALLDRVRLRIDHAGLTGEGRVHDFDPYSLIAYRGGLYLLGHSERTGSVIYLAVERIRSAEFILDADGGQARFAYPARFDPATYTEGTFGIVEGPESKVELLIHNAQTEAYVRSRTIHRTQKFTRRRDGALVMTMTVRGTTELANWLMGMGPWIEVARPAALRNEIAERHAKAARLYRRK